MLPVAIDQIDEAVLNSLVANQVAERRDLEFKRELPGRADADVREFLADVSSLANSQGGDLIYGIEEASGIANKISGLFVDDVDGEILRLDSIIRDSIEPRISGIRTHWVLLASGRGIIIIRIPVSYSAPHRIRFKNSGKFFSITSRGKYEMDVHELRSAFNQSDGYLEKLRGLHEQAIAGAQGFEMPFTVADVPLAVVSFIPRRIANDAQELLINQDNAIFPANCQGSIDWNYTLEGILVHTSPDEVGRIQSYTHTHRYGQVDHVWSVGGDWHTFRGMEKVCWPDRFEYGLLSQAASTQAKIRALGMHQSWVVMVTLLGVKEHKLIISSMASSRPAWRDKVTFAQLVADDMNEVSLLPLLKSFWLVFGLQRPEQRVIERSW